MLALDVSLFLVLDVIVDAYRTFVRCFKFIFKITFVLITSFLILGMIRLLFPDARLTIMLKE